MAYLGREAVSTSIVQHLLRGSTRSLIWDADPADIGAQIVEYLCLEILDPFFFEDGLRGSTKTVLGNVSHKWSEKAQIPSRSVELEAAKYKMEDVAAECKLGGTYFQYF